MGKRSGSDAFGGGNGMQKQVREALAGMTFDSLGYGQGNMKP
jgi:hypothetical protein